MMPHMVHVCVAFAVATTINPSQIFTDLAIGLLVYSTAVTRWPFLVQMVHLANTQIVAPSVRLVHEGGQKCAPSSPTDSTLVSQSKSLTAYQRPVSGLP